MKKHYKNSILFIDPYPEYLEKYFLSLRERGFLIFCAKSWQEAKKNLKTDRPSMILLELIFPSFSGFQILRQIKKNKKYKNIPVLVFTYTDPEVAWSKAIKMGAVGFLTKQNRRAEQTVEYILKVWEEVND